MTSQTLSFPIFSRSAPTPRSIFAQAAQWLVEADERARNRRHMEDLPDWLRVDAGLPPRSDTARSMRGLVLRAMGGL